MDERKGRQCGGCIALRSTQKGKTAYCEKFGQMLLTRRAPHEKQYRAQRCYDCIAAFGGKAAAECEA